MSTRSNKYRVAVIGCGRKGTEHAIAYHFNPATEVVAGADTDPENLALFGRRFNITALYSDYNEMLAKERIDICAPILPVNANPAAVIASAKAGVRAIFCEKPMSASLEDADRMVEECRSRGIPFAAGDSERNRHQHWQAREMMDAGEIGEIRTINLWEPTNEISGGGCQGLSLMRLFAGDADIDWIVGWTNGDPFSDEDQAMGGVVRFTNSIECFMHSKPTAKRGVEVIGTHGAYFSDHNSFHIWKLAPGVQPGSSKVSDLQEVPGLFNDAIRQWRGEEWEGWAAPGDRQADSVQAIIDALDTGQEPKTSGDNMRKVLEIAIALRESHRRGFTPVELPLEDRSLKIMPHKSRWLYKKDVYGEEWYREQMSRHKKGI